MHSACFRSTFLKVLSFLQIKNWGHDFWEEPILQKIWIIWSPLLYFSFKRLWTEVVCHSLDFNVFCLIPKIFLPDFWNFYKLKRAYLISGWNQFFRRSELFGVLLLGFNFKSFVDLNSSSVIRFQCILYCSGVPLVRHFKFLQIKEGDLISGRTQFCKKSELFGPPFSISILKLLRTQVFGHSLDFNVLCMIQKSFGQTSQTSTN